MFFEEARWQYISSFQICDMSLAKKRQKIEEVGGRKRFRNHLFSQIIDPKISFCFHLAPTVLLMLQFDFLHAYFHYDLSQKCICRSNVGRKGKPSKCVNPFCPLMLLFLPHYHFE